VLGTDELSLEFGFAVLQEHLDDLAQLGLEFVEALGLRVGAVETRDVGDFAANSVGGYAGFAGGGGGWRAKGTCMNRNSDSY
jgi:hypothetical protein